jgi:hypothetical protein
MTYTQVPGTAIVYTPEEYVWARRRPAHQRTPIPQVGDEVMYRHIEGGPVVRAEVLAVQNLEDFSDPNLWYFQSDQYGQPVTVEGQMVLAQAHDPWPEVTLRTPYGIGVTREARLRGATGWLPLDWENRPVPQPQILVVHNDATHEE